MRKQIVRCQVCGRQIISKSTENTDRTVGAKCGNGECLLLVSGVVCPICTPSEIEWGTLIEGVE